MSSDRPFVHLHCHSEYSLLDGAGSIKRLVRKAKEFEMNALALTDHGNLFGSLKFYKQALAEGIKPIVGYEAYVAPGSRLQRQYASRANTAYHLTLLAMNRTGFKNLLQLATRAYMEGMYYKPRIDRELLETYGEGIIVLSGCLGGEINSLLVGNAEPNWDKAYEAARWYQEHFGDRYYFEIQNNNIEDQRTAARYMIEMAQKMSIPLVATSDVHYVEREDASTQDILLCINTGRKRIDEGRMKMESDEFHFRSQDEMYNAFVGQEDAVARSQEIADRCELELELGKRFFPVYTPPEGMDSVAFLRKVAMDGLREKYAETPKRWKNGVIGGEFSDEVLARLDTELDVIERQGFPNYFLVVWDFVRVAHERGISCTARGSGVGSLVCFGLGLSQVCPLEYDLLFERFLDVNRAEAPDIDIDFEQQRREEIIQYVRDAYGEENVAQIGTFGTMAAKAAIKDVGRVLGFPISRVEQISSKVPKTPKITLEKALKQNPELAQMVEEDSEVAEIISLAKGCEGLARNPGTHACGILITPQPVVNFVPMHLIKNKTGVVTQWEAAEVEASGLLKMDFLGLRNLSILAQTMNFIEQTTGKKLNPYKFPHDDKETYALLCRGETKGVFQLEGDGIRKLLQRMKPDNFRDIIATLALYRPGPLEGGMVDTYINVKHGRAKAEYVHPVMKDVLEETHGVMVYQEQIMRILNRLGKIELASAYKCIKAISKKKLEIIAKYKEQFIKGCGENNLPAKGAAELFDLIEKFAGYGFNKSHSTAYAKIAYITAYLKAHYPVEFMAALLTGDISQRNFKKKDKTVEHLEDCERMGVEVVLPDVNSSSDEYRVENGKIYFALVAISGCNETVAKAIRRERVASGPYTDLFDFCERLALERIPRATILSLLEAGAFDSFGAKRSQLEAVLDRALQAADATVSDKRRGQMSLFDMLGTQEESKEEKIELPNLPEWPEKEKLAREKGVLGFYRSGHPLEEFRDVLAHHCSCKSAEAKELPHRTPIVLGGIIGGLEKKATKKSNEIYARFELEDEDGAIPVIAWPSTYKEYADAIQPDAVVVCVGTIDNREQFEAEKLAQAADKNAKKAPPPPPVASSKMDDDADDDADDDDDALGTDDAEADGGADSDSSAGQGGTVSSVTFLVDKIIPIEKVRSDYNDGMTLCLFEARHGIETLQTLKEILRAYPGSEPLELCFIMDDNQKVLMNSEMGVKTDPALVSRLQSLLGERNVRVKVRQIRPEKKEEPKWKRRASASS
ncbi:MAG: DNA polymerase III subunit alpha [Planctomycetia bacterium]|nr:DNA polymerase III subunit alpha [Planctomycetia bacterium]